MYGERFQIANGKIFRNSQFYYLNEGNFVTQLRNFLTMNFTRYRHSTTNNGE